MKVLFAIALLLVPVACSKLSGEVEPGQSQPHSHAIEVKCVPVMGEAKESEMSAFPIACAAGETAVGITRAGGLWKMLCVEHKIECQVCVDGVCQEPSGT